MRILLGVILLFLFSCTPQERIARIKRNHPEISDTIFVKDTVISQSVSRDTTFKYYTKDSVVIREGKLVMKYYYNSHDSTVYLKGECLPDTVIRDMPVQVTTVSGEDGGIIGIFKKYLIHLLALVIILLLVFRRR